MAEPEKVQRGYEVERVRPPRPAGTDPLPAGGDPIPAGGKEISAEGGPVGGARSLPRTLGALLGALVGALYLLNPTMGLIELIPDNVPVVGNLDEAGATMLVFYALRYLIRGPAAGGPWPPSR